jgi:endoglucanase
MTWGMTDALGTISLALVGNDKAKQKQIVAAADQFNALIEAQGYRMPFSAGTSGKYPWGSNSFILNNMVILGLAHDFTGKDEYLEAMVMGMDYLLGRNGLAQSYISGYGTKPLQNPHHRFWAKQYDPKFPAAPPGAVSGGPNSSLQDPYVKAAGLMGCQPQKCFMDNIEAWSVNEITVNWNAPFAWVTAYLDENAPSAKGK